MKALVRLIKWLIITAVALVVLGAAGTFSYLLYSDYQANKALTLRTSASDWRWQKDRGLGNRRSSDVQWRIREDGEYRMRRVYGNHKTIAWLTKNEDGTIVLHAGAYFLADCKEGTLIETSVTYSNDNTAILGCVKYDWGNELGILVQWDDVDLDGLPRWSRNYDGFEVDEDFSRTWDFQPAVRRLTLKSAKTVEEMTQ